jgi:hypothetical protein
MANSGFDFTWIEMQHSPLAWKDSRKGYSFFQGPTESVLVQCGVRVVAAGFTPAFKYRQRMI